MVGFVDVERAAYDDRSAGDGSVIARAGGAVKVTERS